ncbi:MAG: S24/S26 family peptidase [Acidobacteria bacterium]|nr:S24/S26 family peptidase [Acidobacteriota bacterium]
MPVQSEELLTSRNATATAAAPAPTAAQKNSTNAAPQVPKLASASAPATTNVAPPARRAPSASAIHDARLDLAAEVLHRFGEVRFVAHGSSMIPSIYPGDLLTVRSDSVSEARRGEIVFFLLGGCPFVHRVTRKWPERNRIVFATRGDALPKEDPSVDASQLLGRVTNIQRRGKSIAIIAKPGPFTRGYRWAVRNSLAFARLVLAVHALRMRLSGRSTDFSDRPASDHLQGFA